MPLGLLGAGLLPNLWRQGGVGSASLAWSENSLCLGARALAAGEPLAAPKTLTLAWSPNAVCLSPVAVAQHRGIFARYNLNIELVNFAGSTEQLLEAIATGHADTGVGMTLRWLKPLEQGFDVRLTAGTHSGCMRLLAAPDSGITRLTDLRGKTVAVADQSSPAKNFFSILLARRGVDPATEVQWRVYPAGLLALALEKGEAQALSH